MAKYQGELWAQDQPASASLLLLLRQTQVASFHLQPTHGHSYLTTALLPRCAGCTAGQWQIDCCQGSPMPQVVAQPHSPALGMSPGPGASKNETGDTCVQTSIASPFGLEKGQLVGSGQGLTPTNSDGELTANVQVNLLVSIRRILSRRQLIQPLSGHQGWIKPVATVTKDKKYCWSHEAAIFILVH